MEPRAESERGSGRRIRMLLIATVCLAMLVLGCRYILHHGPYPRWFDDTIHRVETEQMVIALTFDDGPHPEFTPQILDVLAKHGVPATFFVVGYRAEKNSGLVRRTLEAGHQVANHSYSHKRMVGRRADWIRHEIVETDRILASLGAGHNLLFRAPFGARFYVLPQVLSSMGRRNTMADVWARDWDGSSAEVYQERVLSAIKPGSVILFHDSGGDRAQTVLAVDALIPTLREEGYRFLTMNSLLQIGEADSRSGTR